MSRQSLEPARRIQHLRESVIREMTRLALEHGSVNLAQGFPDFPPPAEIIEAAHRALDAGHNQYVVTWGIPSLRQAICEKMSSWYGLHFEPDLDVVVTCGVTEAITAALLATTNPGDEVVILEPFHENYVPSTIFAGAVPKFVALEAPDFVVDPERLRAAFSSRTRAILVNTPHNPSGRVFTTDEMRTIANLCLEFDTIAITDEIYDHIIHDGRRHVPLASLEGMSDRTITISGLGKTFAVTGWRLGYACARGRLSKALRTVHDFTTICAPAPLQHAAVAAMQLPASYYEGLTRDYSQRRERMMGILDRFGFSGRSPEAAYYVLTDFGPLKGSAFAPDDMACARHMASKVGVAVVPGSSFYGTPGLGQDSIRWAFAKKLDTLDAVEGKLRAAFLA